MEENKNENFIKENNIEESSIDLRKNNNETNYEKNEDSRPIKFSFDELSDEERAENDIKLYDPYKKDRSVFNDSPDGYKEDRNWYKNFVSKVFPGSIRASVFSLSILSIGTGCLSLPQRVGQMSVLACCIFILIGGISAYWTLKLLIIASIRCKETTYSKVISKLCGSIWAKVLDYSILVYIFGVLIIYQTLSKLKINIKFLGWLEHLFMK